MKIKCVASLIDEPIEVDMYFLKIHKILLVQPQAAQSADKDGLVLKVNKLPEAMKLQFTENIFDGK